MDNLSLTPLKPKEIKAIKKFFPFLFVIMITVIAVFTLVVIAGEYMPRPEGIKTVSLNR